MINKISIIASLVIIISAAIYFYNEFKPTDVKSTLVHQDPPPTQPQPKVAFDKKKSKDQIVPATNVGVKIESNDMLQNKMDQQAQLIKPAANLDNLNKQSCKKEIFKSALFSYRLGRYSVFSSAIHCIRYKLNLDTNGQKNYHSFLGAAGKREPSFVLQGETIQITEENLENLSK